MIFLLWGPYWGSLDGWRGQFWNNKPTHSLGINVRCWMWESLLGGNSPFFSLLLDCDSLLEDHLHGMWLLRVSPSKKHSRGCTFYSSWRNSICQSQWWCTSTPPSLNPPSPLPSISGFAAATIEDKGRLQHVVRSAERVIGCNLPSL